jgi:PPM family protein phosphatase
LERIIMALGMEMETTEYELAISPSAFDTTQVRPPTAEVGFEYAAVSDTGKVRVKNEDHYLVTKVSRIHEVLATNVTDNRLPTQYEDDGYSMFIADGMGGMAAGEVASRLAIMTALKLVNRSPKWGFKINKKEARDLFERIRDHIKAIDETITKKSEADHRLFGMGTTLTVAYSAGIDLFIVHLGDSRAYLFRKGRLQLLTKDHTVAQAMADAGYIAPEEIRHHRKRHVLTNFLGGHSGKVKGDVRWLRLADGDRLLLCSDGLTDMVDDAGITEILNKHERPKDAAQTLLDEALLRGGADNVTIIVASYRIPGPGQHGANSPAATGTPLNSGDN